MHKNSSFSPAMLKFRHHFMRALRDFLDNSGFIEVETPYLIKANTPDPYIDPIYALLLHPKKHAMQLRTSPEIWLKKALGLGLDQIYELARVFRDDPLGHAHHREFTMLEWYRTKADLSDLLKDTKDIFNLAISLKKEHFGQANTPPISFKSHSVRDLFLILADIDLDHTLREMELGQENSLQDLLLTRKEHLPSNCSFVDAFFHVMLKYIEPNLNKEEATVITRWPVQLAALAAPCEDDARYSGRFEIYYQGLEIANAYQECNEKEVLLKRFTKENRMRSLLGKQQFPIDHAFLEAISSMPKTAGIALGVDRLLLSILKLSHLRDLIFGYDDL